MSSLGRSRTRRKSQPPPCYRTRQRLRCTDRWRSPDPPTDASAGVGRRCLDGGRRITLTLADRHLSWLGLFADRDSDREHAIVQVCFEVVQIEPIAELDLPTERSAVPLGEVGLVIFLALPF